MSDPLLANIDDHGIARITFNRPEVRNATSVEMLRALHATLLRMDGNDAVRCVVLRGAGEHFMAGGDIAAFAKVAELAPQERRVAMRERLAISAPIFSLIERLAQPVIASVRGAVAGGGMGFVLSCDLAVAASDATFVLSNVKLGLVPDGSSSWHLPRTTGMKVAKQIALLGESVDAATALRWGLVNWVVPPGDVEAETGRIARRLAALSPRALGQAKRLLNTAPANTLADQVMLEGEAIGDCAQTEAFPTAVRAFVNRRKSAAT